MSGFVAFLIWNWVLALLLIVSFFFFFLSEIFVYSCLFGFRENAG